jgi:hypothetical protein
MMVFDFLKLDCYAQSNDQTDVVYMVHWLCSAHDADGIPASILGRTSLSYDPSTPFVPRSSITREMLTEWVLTAIGEKDIAALRESLDAQLALHQTETSLSYLPPEN